MGKIATIGYCNGIYAGAVSGDSNRCPTKAEIIATDKLKVFGGYASNQLVQEGDVSLRRNVNYYRFVDPMSPGGGTIESGHLDYNATVFLTTGGECASFIISGSVLQIVGMGYYDSVILFGENYMHTSNTTIHLNWGRRENIDIRSINFTPASDDVYEYKDSRN